VNFTHQSYHFFVPNVANLLPETIDNLINYHLCTVMVEDVGLELVYATVRFMGTS